MRTKSLSPAEYLQWYNSPDNGLTFTSDKNGVTTIVKLRPLEHDAAICMKNNCDSKTNISKQLKEGNRFVTFNLRYELPNVGLFDINPNGPIYRSERMEYFSYQMKRDIFLFSDAGDTVRCMNVIFERTPSEMPFANFELLFGEVDLSKYTALSIRNQVIGLQPLIFNLQSLNINLPQIKIKDENK